MLIKYLYLYLYLYYTFLKTIIVKVILLFIPIQEKIDNRDNLKTCIKVYDVYGHLKGIIHC